MSAAGSGVAERIPGQRTIGRPELLRAVGLTPHPRRMAVGLTTGPALH